MNMAEDDKPVFKDDATYAPFLLLENEPGTGVFNLILFEGQEMEEVADVFEDQGAESNGHGWEGLAESLVKSEMPEIGDRLNFGSEAGTFVVVSRDLGALQRLAAMLHQAFHDRALLGKLIREADPDLLPRHPA
jgi:hypothetical protein